ncbi:MAG: NifB/NifX family molybdenum-iron cluster-binding protein [Thermodesulfobacteriota bacterium]|nr:NifB/NifX family molybdenum-iron cluster-binding protein [Thermodesulfobacteriota bacterium]
MKVAVATDGNMVSQHFGHCRSYTIAVVEDSRVIGKTLIDSPGHEPGFLPVFLAEKGVDCIIAGGMGQRAQGLFEEKGIIVVVGAFGLVDQVLDNFVNDRLETRENICDH